MEQKDLIQRGNTLEVKFMVTNSSDYMINSSPEFVISGNAIFQMRVLVCRLIEGRIYVFNNLIFVRFCKQRPDENTDYTIKFTCDEFAIKDKCFTSDDGTWHLIHEAKKLQGTYTFDASVVMDIAPTANSFAPLHEDEDSTDFELRGEDGAVRVHRFVLSAVSPVLKNMLRGTWRETTQGHVEVPGTSKATLQQLKNYIYLSTLPEVGLEQLLLLASFYMMPDLEHRCVHKLVQSLTAQNACDLLEFGAKNKMTRLLLTILASVQNGEVQVKDIWDHVTSVNSQNSSLPVATNDDDKSE